MKTRLCRMACLILSAVFVIGTLLSSCETKKKRSETVDYLQKIIEKTFDKEAPAPENTRTELIFKPTSSMPVSDLDSVKLTSYSGTSFESAVFAEAIYKGEKTDISVYSSGTSFIIGSSLFGNTKYGLTSEELEALLPLIFGGAGGYDDEDIRESTAQSPAEIFSAISGILPMIEGKFDEKIVSLSEKYLDIFADTAARATENHVDVEGNITVTVSFNTDCAKKMIKDIFNEAKKDKELKSLIAELLVSAGMDEEEAKDEISDFFSDQDVLNSIYDGLESAPFSVEVIVKADLEYNLTAVSYALNSSDGTKIKTYFDISDASRMQFGYSIEYFDYELLEFVNDGRLITVSVSDNEDGLNIKVDVSSVVSSGGYDLIMGLYSLSLSVKNGEYTLSSDLIDSAVTEDTSAMPFKISGTVAYENKKATVTVTEVKLADNAYSTDITLTEETGVTLPKFPTDFKGMLDITESDLNGIKEAATSNPLIAKIAELIEYYSSFEDDYDDLEYPEYNF